MKSSNVKFSTWKGIFRVLDEKKTLDKVLQTLELEELDLSKEYGDINLFIKTIAEANEDKALGVIVLLIEVYDSIEKLEPLLKLIEEEYPLNIYDFKLYVFSSSYIAKNDINLDITYIHVPSSSHIEYERKIAAHMKRLYDENFKKEEISFPNKRISTDYNSLISDMAYLTNEKFLLTVEFNDVPYEMLCKFTNETDKLVVFGQDALTRSKVNLPYFFRWKWMDDIPANIIILNDPTLYEHDSLNGGWFAGNRNRDYALEIAKILKRIIECKELSLPLNFYGASAGGYSVLSIASFFPDSKVIVDIPQINLMTYHAKKEVEALANYCFDMQYSEILKSKYNFRFNIMDRLILNKNIPNIIYMHNINDTQHENQLKEFTTRWIDIVYRYGKEKKTNLVVKTYDKYHLTKGGHFPLGKEATIKLMIDFFQL